MMLQCAKTRAQTVLDAADPPALMWQAFDPLAPPFLAKNEPPGTGPLPPIGIFPSKKGSHLVIQSHTK